MPMQSRVVAIAFVMAALPWSARPAAAPPAQGGTAARCDRPCLADLMTRYLNAMVAHDPASLPLAQGARFTEDTVELRLGEGLWKTASRLRPYRVDFIDVREGVAATHTLIEEGGSPSLVAVRLKVADRRITEIETMVVRNASEGVLFNPAGLQEPTPTMRFEPPAPQRNTREDMIRIASMYPAGLRAGSFVTVDVPFAPGAYRFENGMTMAGPGCTFQPPSCENIKTQQIPRLPEVTERLVAVDEEMGAVLFRLDFGRGSLPGPKYAGQAITTFEAFKVYNGQVHAAEAILELMPVGAPSGWDR